MKNIHRYTDFLNEKIKASEAYDTMDAVQTLIDGKRDLAFIAVMDDYRYNANNLYELKALAYGASNGLGVMEVKGKEDGQAYILYVKGKEDKAQELADYSSSKGGYLSDSNPGEARLVGNLLDYDEKDIEEYVQRKYGTSEGLNEDNSDNVTLNVKISNIDPSTAQDFLKMFSFMEWTGNVGASRGFKAFFDGDGHFRPKIKVEGHDLKDADWGSDYDDEKDDHLELDFGA